jgi:Smg protein
MDTTIRIQGPHERGRFSPDAWGHLLSLKESGAISRAELEQVIERAMAHLDGRIALDDLRALIDNASLDDGAASVDSMTVH